MSQADDLPGQEGVLPPSTVLQNRYRILALHDQGGSATVYLAERLGVDERVPLAVKELNPDAFSLAEFKNEVNVLYSLNHPNLPKVYDFFEQDGKHYLVMDFVRGTTLKQTVLEHGPLPEDQALDYALQVCDILTYLHSRSERRIIHRDLKPSNLMLTRSGQVKLLDFGIARVPDRDLPGNRLYAYTEDYASPEQLANEETDERSDIYSFGVTLCFLLTGELPPVAGQLPARGLSRDMRRIVGRCLKSRPADRYPSFDDLARDIRGYQRARRTRPTRALGLAAAALGLIAILVAGKIIFAPSLYPLVGPDRVRGGTSTVYEVGLPASWDGSLQSIVWQVIDTQAPGRPLDTQRGRYFSFGSTDLGVYQVQAYLEESGTGIQRPLSEVKRVEVYPGVDIPGEVLAGRDFFLRPSPFTTGAGRQYTWTWEVDAPDGDAGDLHRPGPDPRVEYHFATEGTYTVQVSATVRAAGGVEVTVPGESTTVRAVNQISVDPEQVVNQNGDFEQDYGREPLNWFLIYPDHLAYDLEVGRDSSRSLRFDPWSGVPGSYAVQLVPLQPGASYRLTAWIKGQDVGQNSTLTLEARFRSSVNETYVLREEALTLRWTGTFEWRQVLVYFTIPQGEPVNLETYLRFSGQGTVWFDDCFVESIG